MASAWQQQIFALDARYNAQRMPTQSNFRTLYIRRRSQLLRDKNNNTYENFKNYYKIRALLLQQRYGSPLEQILSHSRSTSISFRSNSRISEVIGGSGDGKSVTNSTSMVVPTRQASASRAIVGGNTIAENYAFTGVHFIFDQHTAPVTMVKFANNDRSRLLCASVDTNLSICEVAADPPRVVAMLKGHTMAVNGCDWSASNDLVASCSEDGSIRLWDAKSGKCLRNVQDKLAYPITCCMFQPANCNLLFTCNNKGEVRILNVSTGRAPPGGCCKINSTILSVNCDNSGKLWWIGTNRGEIFSIICDITGRLRKGRKFQISSTNCLITNISWRSWMSREAYDPSLLINCSDNTLALFRVIDDHGSLQLKWKWNNRHSENNMIRSTFCPIMSFRQGACVVTGTDDGHVCFVDIERPVNRAVVTMLQGHACASLGVSFNYDESFLATSDKQGLVIIWRRA